MEKEKIVSSVYILIFILVIAGIGIASTSNLIKFYVDDEIDYNEWNVDLGNEFETDIASTFWEKFQLININGAIRNLLGQREMNNVIKLNNGYLMTPIGYVDDDILDEHAKDISTFKKYLDDRGTGFLYIMTPYTEGKYDSQLPEGVEDYGNDDADRLVSRIKKLNVDVIDFRETMNDDGVDHYSMMYKTDHHWTTEAGFYAYGKIEKHITDKMNCEVDSRVSDISNYTITKYKNWHLGSRGQRTGYLYAGADDFDLIVPNFETKIENDRGETGKVQELVISTKPLLNKKYTSRYTYDETFVGATDNLINLEAKNNIKILMISDSFAKAVCPYLIMGFKEIRTVYNLNSEIVTKEYIENYDPDIVIMMHYTENAMNDAAYNFSVIGN